LFLMYFWDMLNFVIRKMANNFGVMMKKTGIFIVMIFILFALAAEEFVPRQVIVQFEKNTSNTRQTEIFKLENIATIHQLSQRLIIWLCETGSDITEKEAVASLIKYPEIKYAQLNHIMELRETFPDDAGFSQQWCHHNTGQSGGVVDADIDTPAAWDIEPGGIAANGATVVLAIVDNGTHLSHPDLNFYKNTLEIPGNGIDDDNNGYIDDYDGWNAYNHTGNPGTGSHGTHVAGITAAIGDNGIGVCGVNWDAQVMPVAGSSSSEATVVEAYGYVLEMRTRYNETGGTEGAFVVATNSSFGVNGGQPEDYPVWCAMYDSLGMVGILSAGATANANWNIDEMGDMPTGCDSEWMIGVTNTTDDDVKNASAGYGLVTIDLGAPGTSVYSTDTNTSGYSNKTGTSMASPQVCGAVGYLTSVLPAITLREYEENPGELAIIIRDAIFDGVDPLADLAGITATGGRLNVYNSLLELRNGFYGDISSNEIVDAFDAANVLQYFIGMDPVGAPLPWAIWLKGRADVDGNGFIEAYDASLILRFATGMIETFPVED
jgi:Subtilase family/Dockerin type I domain